MTTPFHPSQRCPLCGTPAAWRYRDPICATCKAANDASTARVCHVSDKVPGAVYIGRAVRSRKASPLGNPFKIDKHGDRAEVIRLYGIYLASEVRRGDPAFIDALIAARGKPLACWCRHDGEPRTADTACHADAIHTYLATHTDAEIRQYRQTPTETGLSATETGDTGLKGTSDHCTDEASAADATARREGKAA